jgi:hypothetical protein
VEAGLPPGADELIDAKLRSLLPDAGREPIRWVSHVPADSVLEGRCDGEVVSFTKTYMGSSFSGYRVGDKMVGAEAEGHEVFYQGQLSPDGSVIEGRWWIDSDSDRGTRRAQGLFVLRRESKVLGC